MLNVGLEPGDVLSSFFKTMEKLRLTYTDSDAELELITRGSHPFKNFDIFRQEQHLSDDQ